MKKILIILASIIIIALGLYYLGFFDSSSTICHDGTCPVFLERLEDKDLQNSNSDIRPELDPSKEKMDKEIPEEVTENIAPKLDGEEKNVLLEIPFTSQAPTGNWKDPRQQDACEEASVLMVMKWIKGEKLNPEEAEVKILAISEWEDREYKSFHDTSARDTMERLIKGYFNYTKAEVKENVTLDMIKAELFKGNAVIATVDGQRLKNPYYTAPGPERHMLVIIGYDADKKEFITNDPGTRRGEKYRYGENHFFSSMRDYPTGDHEPIIEIEKNIIVLEK
ncbi:MAG: C39 family peptidase [bacterium]